MTVSQTRTNLITQGSLDNAGVNLDLSAEDTCEVVDGTTGGTGNGKEDLVKDFDLLFGNVQSLCGWWEREGGFT